MGRWGTLVLLGLAGTACVDARSTICADGRICPPGLECAADGCYTPAQIDACDGVADMEACTYGDVTQGAICRGGVCVVPRCGDGVTDYREDCDDGNQGSGDGCSSECFVERCGNARFDANETCDCGDDSIADELRPEGCNGQPNSATGGLCTDLCTLHCGDESVAPDELCDGGPPKLETCLDFGFDSGRIGCTGFCTLDFSGCRQFGWRPVLTDNQTWMDVVRVGDTGFAVSEQGSIAQLVQGEGWLPGPGMGVELHAVWAASPTDAWAVGAKGVVLHSAGAVDGWPGDVIGSSLYSWVAIDGTAADDIWIAGGPRVWHFDGAGWSQAFAGAGADFTGIAAVAADDVWVAGQGLSGAIVAHWNGIDWQVTDLSALSGGLNGIAAAPGGELWAVGEAGTVLHYQGGGWTRVTVPSNEYLQEVFAAGDEVFVVGLGGVILHRDATGWTQLDSGTTAGLEAVHGSSPADVLVAGTGTVRRWGGIGWAVPRTGGSQMRGLHAVAPDDVIAVGEASTVLRLVDGAWAALPAPTPVTVVAVWGGAPDRIYVAGPAQIYPVSRWDGTWNAEPVAIGETMRALWGDGNQVFVAGDSGNIYQWDGDEWLARAPLQTTRIFHDLWGTASDLWGVGSGVIVHHYEGAWTEESSVVDDLRAVWGDGAGLLLAAGTEGIVYRHQGSWEPDAQFPAPLYDLSGTSAQDVFVVGGAGTIMWNDGAGWVPVRSGVPVDLRAVWASPQSVFFAGGNGTILRLVRSQP